MATRPKSYWPELVGKLGTEAAETIKAERPDLTEVTIRPKDSMFTMEYREDRVRIFIDTDNKVVSAPTTG
jgi:hypothetical protein